MKRVAYVFKPVGFTPLEIVEGYRAQNKIPLSVKLGYAGRLDPMASGVLPVLIGEENNNRTHYEQLPKTYEFKSLFGITTDSYDLLGAIEKVSDGRVGRARVVQEANVMLGEWDQEYPPYSAARVDGKPLYWWARQARLSEIQIPSKKIQIDEIDVLSCRLVPAEEVVSEALSGIRLVRGDFRQDEIISQWLSFSKEYVDRLFEVFNFCVSCSSGVYVRGLANLLGQRLGCGAIAYSINRTCVGEVGLSSCVRLDSIRRDG